LRRPSQSLSAPENTLVTEAVASAMPSIKPTSAALAPSVETRNTGRSAWIISDELSMKSDTKPSAQTARGTARQPEASAIPPMESQLGRCVARDSMRA
jgi:hypothetical protein